MTTKKILIALVAAAAAAPAWAQVPDDPQTALNGDCGSFRNVSVYGKDNRTDYCSRDAVLRGLADSVVSLFNSGGLTRNGTTTLMNSPDHVSAGQRFSDEPAAAFCTGFLVGDDLVATAGHCVKDHPAAPAAGGKPSKSCAENLNMGDYCENIKFVFGFRKELGGFLPASVPAANVYSCASVVLHSKKSGPDYTIVRLDRKVTDRMPLAINRGNAGLSAGVPLIVMGHPSGLPLKIADDAEVTGTGDVYVNNGGTQLKWSDKRYSFLTNLDTFHGNSGSPVFNARTLLVEGILVSGDGDYEPDPDNPGSTRVSTYTQAGHNPNLGQGVGEVCTKISVPARAIPANGREKTMLELDRKANGDLYGALLRRLKKAAAAGSPSGIIPIPNYVPPPSASQPHVTFI